METDDRNLVVRLAVLQEKVENLEGRFNERHDALGQRLQERDEALQEALQKIHDDLGPLRQRVDALERLKLQITAVAAAVSTIVGGAVWVAERLGAFAPVLAAVLLGR